MRPISQQANPDSLRPDMTPGIPGKSSFTVIIPFYNEAAYLGATIESWLRQTLPPQRLILVDNASTDNSREIAQALLNNSRGLDVLFLEELAPGKLFALKKGLEEVMTEYVALADADTFYPPHYLALCDRLFRESSPEVAALMALVESDRPHSPAARFKRRYFLLLSLIFPRHCYTGGAGQIFRTRALRDAGGFSETIWPHVLMDHEIMYRIFKQGTSRYHMDLWCLPSERRQNRRNVRWSLFERLLYQLTPYGFQDWFFYRFLGPRFAKKNLNQLRLREKTWQNP